jgi:hypothetical protein
MPLSSPSLWFRFLSSSFRFVKSGPPVRKNKRTQERRARLEVEQLETRIVPSNYMLTGISSQTSYDGETVTNTIANTISYGGIVNLAVTGLPPRPLLLRRHRLRHP